MEPLEDTAQPAPLGEVLSRERERLGLSRAEIAQRLHMSASQVEALEAGDYARLPKGTFLRGFVRNYAKQLSLPADPLLARLQEAAPRPPSPGIIVPSQNIRFDPIGERLSNPYMKAGALALVAIAVAFAAMYWWLFIKPSPPGAGITRKSVELGPPQQLAAAPVSAPEVPPPRDAPKAEPPKAEAAKIEQPKTLPQNGEVPTKTPSPALRSSSPAPEGTPGGGSTSAAKTPAPQAGGSSPAATNVSSVQPAPLKAARGERKIKFRFKGESWVEIKDGQGRLLISRLNAPGSEAEVAGRPPFTVVVGNAPDVQMLYDDREFPLEPHTRVAVARFTVE